MSGSVVMCAYMHIYTDTLTDTVIQRHTLTDVETQTHTHCYVQLHTASPVDPRERERETRKGIRTQCK